MSDNDPSWPTEGDDQSSSPPPSASSTPSSPPAAPGSPPAASSSPPAAPSSPPSAPSAPPAAPGSSPVAGAGTSAGLGVRFGARLIDGIITFIIGFVIGLIIPGDSVIVSSILGAIISLGYFVALETSNGATPGKQVLNLKVVGASGGNPTVEESLKRNIWLGFQIVPILGGLAGLAAAIAIAVTISTNDDNRGLHDQFANTRVPKTA